MKASTYRARATEMRRCARSAHTEQERAEYLNLAQAWTALAEAAERGLEPEEPCEDPEA
jgi:hypothetical protein